MGLAIVLNRRSQAPAEETPAFGAVAERFRRAGELERAVALCQEGLSKFPEYLSARVTLGWALLDLGRYREARTELERVMKRAPDNLAAIRGLAQLHDRTDQSDMDQAANWMPDPEPVVALEPPPPVAASAAPAAVVPAVPVASAEPVVEAVADPQQIQLVSPIDVALEASLGLLATHPQPVEEAGRQTEFTFELAPKQFGSAFELPAVVEAPLSAEDEISALEAQLAVPAALVIEAATPAIEVAAPVVEVAAEPEPEPEVVIDPPMPALHVVRPRLFDEQLARFLRAVEPPREEVPFGDETWTLEQDGWAVEDEDLSLQLEADVPAPLVEVLPAEPIEPVLETTALVPIPATHAPRQTAVVALERFLRRVEARKIERIRRSVAS